MKGKGLTLAEYVKKRKPIDEMLDLQFHNGGFTISPSDLYSLTNANLMRKVIESVEEKSDRMGKKIVIHLKGEW